MNELNSKETLGLLEAILIIDEKSETKEEFKEAVRRIQNTIEKGVTEEADQSTR